MGTISVSLPTDGTTADVADYNTPITTIVNAINGGLDNDNIASGAAIAGSKLAADGVTDTQLDYPRWWQEIGRTTLESAGDTISVTSLPTRKYILIVVDVVDTGGTIDVWLRFNNDSGNNYAFGRSVSGAAESTSTGASAIVLVGALGSPSRSEVFVKNVAAQEKLTYCHSVARGTAGAGNLPSRVEGVGKWANTADAISRIDIVNGSGGGDFAIGSQVIVLGHD